MPREPRQRVQCNAHSRRGGGRCKAWASPGQKVCHTHGGASPQAVVAAEVRLATQQDVFSFGQHKHLSPGEALLNLIASRHARLELLGDAIQQLVDEAGGDLNEALTGETYITDTNGNTIKVGEHVRGLLQLETALAGQLGQWDIAAVRAQIDIAREKRRAETAAEFSAMVRLLMDHSLLALTTEQRQNFTAALSDVVGGVEQGQLTC
jgi:hypothetical protein